MICSTWQASTLPFSSITSSSPIDYKDIDLVILIVIDYHHDHILIMIMENLGDGVHESARLDPLANNASPMEDMRLEIVAKIITIILGSDENC